MIDYELLRTELARHPYPLLFATVSGAHLYGFPSPDSDFDLRGAHILPPGEAMGLMRRRETVESCGRRSGVEMDVVTHDVLKYFNMLLKRNGYVLEQLYSPLVVQSRPEFEELRHVAKGCITRHHSHHYLGFAETQWEMLEKEQPARVKPLLYTYRVLLTGIHLMRTCEVESNLVVLNEIYRLPYVPELIARKTAGAEDSLLQPGERAFHEAEYARLRADLAVAATHSPLPEDATAQRPLHDLLVRIRYCFL